MAAQDTQRHAQDEIRQLIPSEVAQRFVTVRSIAIACGLMPPLAMWVVQSELFWYTAHSTIISLFFHVTTTIFVLGILNLGVARLAPGRELSPGEILTIYVMLSVAGTLCSHDMCQLLIPMLAAPRYNANAVNRWDELLLQHVPSWALVTDVGVCRQAAEGNQWLYRLSTLAAWMKPLAAWSVFILALMLALLFINCIFRQTWTEKERLSFPVIQIPMMLATELGSLLRNRLFWIGFGIAAVIDMNNYISFMCPAVPLIPTTPAFLFRDYLTERPWNAIANLEANINPFVIGLAFFLPADLAFSCWFFFLLAKMQLVATSALGVRELPGFPFLGEQGGGAYLALGVLAIWLARRHLGGVWRAALGRPGGADESGEPVSYRTAVFGLVLCTVVLVGFGCSLGGSVMAMIVFFGIYYLYAIAIARIRAELGPPAHDLHFMGPQVIINNAVGTANVDVRNQTAFSLLFWFNRAYRAHFSAHSIEGFKIAQLNRIVSRSMLKAMFIAVVVGMVSAYWALLHLSYKHGFATRGNGLGFGLEAWWNFENWRKFPEGPKIAATVATAVGFLATLALGFMRMRFTWWVWHPVGYATSLSWSMGKLWVGIMIAWMIKVIIVRYYGADAYRKAIPFFVGLVMGEFLTASGWCIYGVMTSQLVYHFFG